MSIQKAVLPICLLVMMGVGLQSCKPTSTSNPTGPLSNPISKATSTFTVTAIPSSVSTLVPTATATAPPSGSVTPTATTVPPTGSGVSIGPLDLFPASDLAATIKGPGITVSNITFKGSGQTAGFFTGGMDAVGLDAGIILSTGLASCVTALNSAVNCDSHLSLPGDADLTALAGGVATYDATALEFDFVPTFSNVSLRYVFASEEYNQWVGQFNDLFALYLDGVNVATLPDGTVVSINNVNACVNPGYYVNNIDQATGLCSAMPPSAGRPTAMNGMTQVLSIAVTLTPDITHHLKLVIADTKDDQLDSNLFIGLGSLKCGPP